MRILHIPQTATVEIAAESDFLGHRLVQKAMRQIEPSYFYMWLRRSDEGRVGGEADISYMFEDTPGLSHSYYAQQAGLDMDRVIDLFSWHRGFYPIDAVFCSRAGVAPLLSLGLAASGAQFPVPIVLSEAHVFGPGEKGHNYTNQTEMAIRGAAYAVCFGMYFSRWEKDEALSAAELVCAPGVIKGFEERAFVVDWPVEVAEDVRNMPKPTDRKRLLYAGRLNSNKHWDKILSAYGKVLMSRKDVEVYVHAGTGAFGKIGDPADHRWHMTSERLPYKEFIKVLGQAHVGAYMSDSEGMCATPQEMILANVATAMPDRPWVRQLFYPVEYPFLVKSWKELPGMLDWMLDHYEEAHARLAPVREFLLEERSWTAFFRRFSRLVQALKEFPRPEPFKVFLTMAQDAEASRNPVVDRRLPYSRLLQLTKNFRGRPGAQYMGSYSCYQAVRHLDPMDSADPMLAMAGLLEKA